MTIKLAHHERMAVVVGEANGEMHLLPCDGNIRTKSAYAKAKLAGD